MWRTGYIYFFGFGIFANTWSLPWTSEALQLGSGIFLWTRMRGTRRPFGDATQLWVSHQPMLRRGSVYEYTFGELCMGGHEGMQLPRIFLPCNDCGCGRSHVSQDLVDFFGSSGTTAHYDEMDTFWCGVSTSLLFG